jgi:hypothetical protein
MADLSQDSLTPNPGPIGYEVGLNYYIVVFAIQKLLPFEFASDFGIKLEQCVLPAIHCFLL